MSYHFQLPRSVLLYIAFFKLTQILSAPPATTSRQVAIFPLATAASGNSNGTLGHWHILICRCRRNIWWTHPGGKGVNGKSAHGVNFGEPFTHGANYLDIVNSSFKYCEALRPHPLWRQATNNTTVNNLAASGTHRWWQWSVIKNIFFPYNTPKFILGDKCFSACCQGWATAAPICAGGSHTKVMAVTIPKQN